MTRSANEVMVLAGKAARGAGAPPAQASEFGRAVVHHICAGRDMRHVSEALDALPKGPIMDFPVAFTRVLETGGASPRGQVEASAWLPLAQSYADALPFAARVTVIGEVLDIIADVQQPAAKVSLGRLTLPDTLFDKMNALAARILVPESDASRRAGAGAGLTDND